MFSLHILNSFFLHDLTWIVCEIGNRPKVATPSSIKSTLDQCVCWDVVKVRRSSDVTDPDIAYVIGRDDYLKLWCA